MFLRFFLAGAVVLLGAGFVSCQQDTGEAIVKKIVSSWEQRRTRIRTVEYELEGHTFYPRGSLTTRIEDAAENMRANFPPTDLRLPFTSEYTFQFQDFRMRRHVNRMTLNEAFGKFLPTQKTDYFDGKTTRSFQPRETNTNADYTPSPQQPDLKVHNKLAFFLLLRDTYPMLFTSGYVNLYDMEADLSLFSKPPRSDLLAYSHQEMIDGHRCAVLKSVPETSVFARRDVFVVDLEQDGAIRRWQLHMKGKLYCTLDISYQQNSGEWIAKSWRCDEFKDGERLGMSKVTTVKSFRLNPELPGDRFIPPLRENHVVSLTESAGNRYVVGADHQTLIPFGQTNTGIKWYWWALGCLLLSIAIWIYWKRASNRSASV